MTAQITINLEPAYIVLQDDFGSTIRSCSVDEVHAALIKLGCVSVPLRDCLVRATVQIDSELYRDLKKLLNIAPSPRAA